MYSQKEEAVHFWPQLENLPRELWPFLSEQNSVMMLHLENTKTMTEVFPVQRLQLHIKILKLYII